MPTIPTLFPSFNDDTAHKILLYFLSADSIGPENAFISTSPLIVAGVRYTPCEIIAPFAKHGGPVYVCIDHEVSRLYKNIQSEEKASFWKGVRTIIDGMDDLSAAGELGKYGLSELLESLFNNGYIPSENTQGASSVLKAMIQSQKYINQPLTLWSHWHKNRQKLDVHWEAVRTYTHLQRKEVPDFWKGLIEEEIDFPSPESAQLIALRGLALCDLSEAQRYLPELTGRTADFYSRARVLLEIVAQRSQRK